MMATIGKLELEFGIWRAPWLPLAVYLAVLMRAVGIREHILLRVLLPLTMLGWTRAKGNARRRWFLLQYPRENAA